MLTVDATRRPTAAQALTHPWIKRHVAQAADSSPPPSPLHALRASPRDQARCPQPSSRAEIQSRHAAAAAAAAAAAVQSGQLGESGQAGAMQAAGWSVPSSPREAERARLRPEATQEASDGGLGQRGTGAGEVRENSSDSEVASSIEGGPRRVSTGLAKARAALQRLSLF